MKTTVRGSNDEYFYSINKTCKILGLSRRTIDRMEERGEFPKRVLLSPMRKGFRVSDLNKWMEGLK